MVIGNGVEVSVFESLGHGLAGMGIVTHRDDCLSLDVLVVGAVEIEFNSDISREVEVRVKGAGSMARFDCVGSGELPDVVCAGCRGVQALLDAVAFVLHLRECQIDLCDNTGDIEAARIWAELSFQESISG